jgi:hypothetical protein
MSRDEDGKRSCKYRVSHGPPPQSRSACGRQRVVRHGEPRIGPDPAFVGASGG